MKGIQQAVDERVVVQLIDWHPPHVRGIVAGAEFTSDDLNLVVTDLVHRTARGITQDASKRLPYGDPQAGLLRHLASHSLGFALAGFYPPTGNRPAAFPGRSPAQHEQ
jgi:hypothetical protein